MSKISAVFLLLTGGMIFFTFLIFPTSALALQSCSVRTTPTPLISTNRIAGFYIDVGNNKNYDYRVEFKCGVGSLKTDATKYGTKEIYVGLDKSSTKAGSPCEFDAGSHEINVYALAGSSEVLQCTPVYTVVDSIYQCSLSIDKAEGITSISPINLSGENLTKDGRFVVFFDDDAIDIPNNAAGRALIDSPTINVSTSQFGPKSIPQDLMTPGYHTISLRRKMFSSADWHNPLKQEKDFFGLPLCPISFNVGTPEKPGAVSSSKDQSVSDKCKIDNKDCSKAGGDPCGTDPKNPGFKTAIGCIHSTPKAFVEDVLKFATGIGGGLAFMMMLFGAFQMMKSAGNPQSLQEGKDVFTNAIIGILFIIFSILLMKIIGIDILGIPGFS